MRLSPKQNEIIRQVVHESIGHDARIWLFGSRTDDQAIGGDIDLLIECDNDLPLRQKLRIQAMLEMKLHMPVDLLTHARSRVAAPIVNIARATGVPLT